MDDRIITSNKLKEDNIELSLIPYHRNIIQIILTKLYNLIGFKRHDVKAKNLS